VIALHIYIHTSNYFQIPYILCTCNINWCKPQ